MLFPMNTGTSWWVRFGGGGVTVLGPHNAVQRASKRKHTDVIVQRIVHVWNAGHAVVRYVICFHSDAYSVIVSTVNYRVSPIGVRTKTTMRWRTTPRVCAPLPSPQLFVSVYFNRPFVFFCMSLFCDMKLRKQVMGHLSGNKPPLCLNLHQTSSLCVCLHVHNWVCGLTAV